MELIPEEAGPFSPEGAPCHDGKLSGSGSRGIYSETNSLRPWGVADADRAMQLARFPGRLRERAERRDGHGSALDTGQESTP